MQYFGEIQTKYEEVFLTQSYMYFKKDEDENISAKDLKNLIKTKDDRKKNIIVNLIHLNKKNLDCLSQKLISLLFKND